MAIIAFVLLPLNQARSQDFNYKQKRFELTYQQAKLKIKGSMIIGPNEKSKDLLNVLKTIPKGRDLLIELDMFGGDIALVNKIFDLLKGKCHDRGYQMCRITTRVEMFRTCASACIPLFMLGDHRMADRRADFGFHQAALIEGFLLIPFMSEHELLRRGVNPEWVIKNKEMFKTLRISWLRPHQMMGSNIVQEIFEGSSWE
jgi:hypothetical protein